ncbi:hypothetical protein GBAR_LOCUS23357 [Geodia barretti]|uniref:PX domain-containing protein n=2 Tax=Geodia barretti TaxID=519541 RepID=A0AA35X8E1_GEOBA|nr:hypothetical protein GBAR_LOCUS23357 [Geodia barretti]
MRAEDCPNRGVDDSLCFSGAEIPDMPPKVIRTSSVRKSADQDGKAWFQVLRDYEAFENLQKDVLQSFPNLKLPSLPRKYHLFTSDTDIEERQIAFDCLLKVLCKERVMCTSSTFLHFLGFKDDADVTYLRKRAEYIKREQPKEIETIDNQSGDTQLFTTTKKAELIDEEYASPGGNTTTFAGDDVTFGPKNDSGKRAFAPKDLFVTDMPSEVVNIADHSELLDISDTVDDLLQTKRCAAVVTEQPDTASSIINVEVTDVKKQNMESGDILAYIETNTAENESLNIF